MCGFFITPVTMFSFELYLLVCSGVFPFAVRRSNLAMLHFSGMEIVRDILTQKWKSMWKFKVTLGLLSIYNQK